MLPKRYFSFPAFWAFIHLVALVVLIVYILCKPTTERYGFGFGIGLNPPVDIHIMGAEEIAKELQKESRNPYSWDNPDSLKKNSSSHKKDSKEKK